MQKRGLVTLVVIVAAIAGLGLLRSLRAPAERVGIDERQSAVTSDSTELPSLLDFGRGTCIPCQKMMPVLDELAEKHAEQIDVHYLDLSEAANQERAKEFRVRVIPTQILLAADGSEVGRHEGFWAPDEIEARLEELGWIPR